MRADQKNGHENIYRNVTEKVSDGDEKMIEDEMPGHDE